MASVNKSHGNNQGVRQSLISSRESPVLSPVSVDGKTKVDDLIEKVNGLVLSEDMCLSKEQEDDLKECFKKACSDSDTLEYAVERLHQLCLRNRSVIAKVAVTLNVLWGFQVNRVKLQNVLLTRLQNDFENRHKMQAVSPEKFLNAVSLLGEIYARVRIGKYPIHALCTPVVEYLEVLLTGDESEVDLFVHMLILIRHSLLEELEENTGASEQASLVSNVPFQGILSKIRSTLMSRNLSSQSRLWLLFVMDITSSGDFKPPSPSLQLFYKDKDHLGAQAENLLMLIEPPKTSNTPQEMTPTAEQTQLEPSNEESIVGERVSQINISPKQKDKALSQRTYESKKPSPEKYGGIDKRENFRSAFNVDSNKGKEGKSYWLHDDRFDQDQGFHGVKDNTTGRLTRPRASDGNWRQTQTSKKETENKSSLNSSDWRHQDQKESNVKTEFKSASSSSSAINLLAGHVDSENWDDD